MKCDEAMPSTFSELSKNALYRKTSSEGLAEVTNCQGFARGITIGFKDDTPTIPLKKQIHVVGLKIFIRSSEEKKSAIKCNLVQGLDQKINHIK
jgi:hypothetical protein